MCLAGAAQRAHSASEQYPKPAPASVPRPFITKGNPPELLFLKASFLSFNKWTMLELTHFCNSDPHTEGPLWAGLSWA